MRNKIMIDIETLGRKPGCVVLEVGIVAISGETGKPYDRFSVSTSVSIKLQENRTIEADTLVWWMAHPAAWAEICKGQINAPSPVCVAKSLAKFIEDIAPDEVWSNSPTFDCAIMRDFLEQYGQVVPWEYWKERDFRTVKARQTLKYVPPKNAHSAVADAIAQADYLDAIGIWTD